MNINKDIEILKEMLKDKEQIIRYHAWIGTKALDSIENVLAELERLYKSDTSKEKSSMDYYNKYKETKSELETHKKMVIILAKKMEQESTGRRAFSCEFKTQECNENGCVKCIIDWAKREVEKDE